MGVRKKNLHSNSGRVPPPLKNAFFSQNKKMLRMIKIKIKNVLKDFVKFLKIFKKIFGLNIHY